MPEVRAEPQSQASPELWYQKEEANANKEAEIVERRLRTLATARFFAFLGGVVPLLLLETTPRGGWPLLIGISLLGAVLFGGLVRAHRRQKSALRTLRMRQTLHREGLARLQRNWKDLPQVDLGPIPDTHPWAVDLDMLGFGSLAHLLGTPRTGPGRAALRAALLGEEVGSLETREAHRAAVSRLAQKPELLSQIQLAARLPDGVESADALASLLAWAEGEPWKPSERPSLWIWGARGVALTNLILVVLWLGGAPPVWLVSAIASVVLWFRIRPDAHRRFDAVEGATSSLARWSALLQEAANLPGDTPLLRSIREGATEPVEAARALRQLQRISDWAEIRRNAFVYYPLAILWIWDLHPLVPLERWRARHGHRIRAWMEGVGTLERLTAFALLRFDHPAWTMPTERVLIQDDPSIRALDLVHPLLPPEIAVGNEVEIPSGGRLLLLTGSNMSGKSTLLRAVGVNQILLLAGGPVAASEYRGAPLSPWTCMRIRDSLTQGVSLFMAELKRLRQVVDAARQGPVLVLLDEILQGTNTAERRTAARIILTHLREARACGAVSTHDLTLADDENLAEALEQVHLRESVVEVEGVRTLTFDHRLRPGPATSKNALILLELVGLGPSS